MSILQTTNNRKNENEILNIKRKIEYLTKRCKILIDKPNILDGNKRIKHYIMNACLLLHALFLINCNYSSLIIFMITCVLAYTNELGFKYPASLLRYLKNNNLK